MNEQPFWAMTLCTFLLNFPYYMIVSIPLFHKRRVRPSLIVMIGVITGILYALFAGFYVFYSDDWTTYNLLLSIIHYIVLAIEGMTLFAIPFRMLLYLFLISQTYSMLLNTVSVYIAKQIGWFPGWVSSPMLTFFH